MTTIHTRFCREWTLITDRLLAGAAINPKRFTELVEDFGLRPSFTPDDLTYDLFVLLQAIGEGDIACSAESIADELSRWCRHDRDDILNVLYSFGSDGAMYEDAARLAEYATRAKLWRNADRYLTDPKPVGQIVADLYAKVQDTEVTANAG